MHDSDYVMYTFNILELQKKEKEDANKNQKSEEQNAGKSGKDQKGKCEMQTGQIKKDKASSSELSIKERKDVDYHVQQEVQESIMNSFNVIDFIIMSLEENKEELCKKMIHNERSEEINESKKEKEQQGSFEEDPLDTQQQQQEGDINGELEPNIITSNNIPPDNIDHIRKDNNTNSGSKIFISDEEDQNCYLLNQGIRRRSKYRSIIDIYKCTNRLSSPEDEYNWSHPSTLENQKPEVHKEGKTGKDQVNTFEETLPNKQKQQNIHGEFESLEVNFNDTLLDDNIDHRSNLSTKENKDEDYHVNKGISKSTMFSSLYFLGEVILNKTFEEHGGRKTRKDQEDSIEEELPDQQQQRQKDIIGDPELNKVTGEDQNNFDRVLNDNDTNCGSKLLTRDENDRNYRITQGLPGSRLFRSISNLYKCAKRLSPVEDEYNWNLPREKDSNMNRLKKEISSNKMSCGCTRKCCENQKGKGEKDATT